ncbi:MAG: hypothetical protein COW03_14160 [Cytophagales bacterium CG12_big_fil_rev_8_21_14_0_65_40_12]|nr:MAG: hypothetical protein COW03_14160 [Cytophagales bacterium CG12_big_fil_rev_8_21_14_0_65_40_12]PIW06103.1 MAG: hypothetical protein COW40_01335 [Cytophagales bacterium CG17_big_fil_post_rev_8_21_14_2_50_40_13]
MTLTIINSIDFSSPQSQNWIIGVISGVIATSLWSIIIYVKFQARLYLSFSHLKGDYEVFRKYTDSDKPEYHVNLSRKKTLLTLSTIDIKDKKVNIPKMNYSAKINLDHRFMFDGKGFYIHNKTSGDKPLQLWGTMELLIDKPDIYLKTSFVNVERQVINDVWFLKKIIN